MEGDGAEPQTPAAKVGDANSSLNVLLLGPTGVGKSTFINALCNYLVYPSLDEALSKNDVQSLIYSEFTTSTFENRKLVKKTVSVGKRDPDEGATTKGASVTQKCKAYNFVAQDGTRSIRLIDTPGIGDTRGFDQDVKNMNDILSFIAQYEVLNAVCILLKPNEERLTGSLRYCIVQLLQKLHKDASRNILFCFTNSRSTFYRPGNTLFLVEEMLKPKSREDFIELDIKLDDANTLYHFDSEAFIFLASAKNGISFSEKETRDFRESWTQSSEEAARLIGHIAELEPHMIHSTLSLNRVRVMLESMEVPLRDIADAIQKNLVEIRRVRKEVDENFESIKDDYRLSLITKETYVETVALKHPRLICNNSEVCREEVCHEGCRTTETSLGFVGILGKKIAEKFPEALLISSYFDFPLLSDPFFGVASEFLTRALTPDTIPVPAEEPVFCTYLSFSSGKCRVCNCPNDKHIRVRTERRETTRLVEDPNVRQALHEKAGEMERKKIILGALEAKEESFKSDYGVILKAAARFATFLDEQSIIAYHGATRQYLEEQIKEQSQRGNQAEVIELKGMLASYQTHVNQFKLSRSSGSASDTGGVTAEDVNHEIENLLALNVHGPQLKEWMDSVQSTAAFAGACAVLHREEVTFHTHDLVPLQAAASNEAGSHGKVMEASLEDVE